MIILRNIIHIHWQKMLMTAKNEEKRKNEFDTEYIQYPIYLIRVFIGKRIWINLIKFRGISWMRFKRGRIFNPNVL